MSKVENRFMPRARPWDSLALLGRLDRHDIALSHATLSPHLKLLDYAMVTEFDAQNFDDFLTKRASDGVIFTPEFMAFRAAWRWDEWNHYIGYRRIMHILTGIPEAELHERTIRRPYNFDAIAPFLEDEFLICMTFAYDEIVTQHSCVMATDIFRSFGHENFLTWIKLVGRDEGWHFSNLVNVIRLRHRHRLSECEATLGRLLAWDFEQHPYYSTFVLDHDLALLGKGTLERCANTLLRALCR
jgi:hypothetical protein